MTEPLPSELGRLHHLLVHFSLESSLSGLMPSEVGQLSHLTLLDVSVNSLDGSTPTEFDSLSELQYLIVSMNWQSGVGVPTYHGLLDDLCVSSLGHNVLI